ncbi:MAG: WecB/TagA/CpsF family glycosyltransferase [Scytonema sp. PMC 1069.18]|nr:WecB/TagA/CpsF family glycosyltransferase [Scytonema sp. PMC 1069.18]
MNFPNRRQGDGVHQQLDRYEVETLPNLNVYLLERRITCMTVPAIVEAIYRASVEGKKMTVANYNVHSFNLSMQLPWYYQFLQNAEITHCDSTGILKAIKWMGLELPIEYRSSYTLLMPKLLTKCNEHKLSVFLLGSKPQSLDTALERLSQKYPKTNFFGHHGYFDKEDREQNEAVIQKINQVKPNVLIVGMGMPLQENWVQQHRSRLSVNAIMLGGAIIDRLAGVVPDCPQFIANVGLEWLYRFCREPKRLAARYLLGNPAFALQIALGQFYAPPLRVQLMKPIHSYRLEVDALTNNLSSTGATQYQDLPTTICTKAKRLVDYLIEANLLTKAQAETASLEQKLAGILFNEVRVRPGVAKQPSLELITKDRANG